MSIAFPPFHARLHVLKDACILQIVLQNASSSLASKRKIVKVYLLFELKKFSAADSASIFFRIRPILRLRIPLRLFPLLVDLLADEPFPIDIRMQAVERELRRQHTVGTDER